ncbi:MAG: hypothetical protein EZS28_043474, partial [Streblomastix strix]
AISISFINTFLLFANLCDNKELQLLVSKKLYPHLFRLFSHISNKFIFRVINAIFTLLMYGTKTTTSASPHPHFVVIQEFEGTDQLYKLFKKIEADKLLKVKVGICLCLFFRAQEVPKKLSVKIFPILKALSQDLEKSNQVFAMNVLNALAKNQVNKEEIEKG